MGDVSLLCARLVAACDQYPFHTDVAAACGITWTTLRRMLRDGVVLDAQEPFVSFARDYWAADSAFCKRVFATLLHGRLELEFHDMPAGEVPDDLVEQIAGHFGPVITRLMAAAKTVTVDEKQKRPTVSIKMRSPQNGLIEEWFKARWRSQDGAQSLAPILESEESKGLSMDAAFQKMSPKLLKSVTQNWPAIVRQVGLASPRTLSQGSDA
jgi:hypothetical protein